MARTGLFLTLREIIRPGRKVIMSPLTIVDVVNSVLLAGGIPVFGDIVRQSCALDPDCAESLIDAQTDAILVTHLHGESAGSQIFREICDRRGVRLIEDAAQAFGAVENGRRLGTIGDAGIYSFGFYKHLTTWRGGMVVSDDVRLIERIRHHVRVLPDLGRSRLLARAFAGLMVETATWPPVFSMVTHPIVRRDFAFMTTRLDPEARASRLTSVPDNFLRRMRSAQARIGIQQLDGVDLDSLRRIDNALLYHDGLEGLPDLITPRHHTNLSNIYTYFPIQIENRDRLLRLIQRNRRDFAAQHLRNCADLPMFSEFQSDCPNARAAARELVLLPTYPRYPRSQIERNVELIRNFCQSMVYGRAKATTG
jgi:dTDP-4-amino-4,6-dideoxygalactose transaminase